MTNAELLAKIKAEIERRKSLLTQRSKLTYDLILETFIKEYDDLLSFLSTLESEKPMNLEEEIKRFVAEYGYERSEDILLIAIVARQFYELGCCRAAEKYDEIEYNRQRAEESVPNDLEEYASSAGFDYVDNIVQEHPGHRFNDHDVEFAYRDGIIAGAKWGAEHSGSLGTMVSGWMARDRNGHLNFFLAEPRRFTNVREEEYWIGHARMKMPNEFLPELSWSNEPIKVKLKVEKYESSKS